MKIVICWFTVYMQCEFENWEEIGKDWCEDFSSEKNVCATSTALSHKALHYAHLPPFYCCSKIESTAHNKSFKLSESSGELSKAPFSWNYSSHWPTFHCKLVKQKSRCKNKWNSNIIYKCISAQARDWMNYLTVHMGASLLYQPTTVNQGIGWVSSFSLSFGYWEALLSSQGGIKCGVCS